MTQTYTYDHLNRLTSAAETGGGANWSQGYQYDTFGNLAVPNSQNTGSPALPLAAKHRQR